MSQFQFHIRPSINPLFVESCSKSHFGGGEFDHLVAYSLACTFESEVVSARKYDGICFGSLNEVINDDDLICLDEGKD